jgi:hypothetical protein
MNSNKGSMLTAEFDYQKILENWSVDDEQSKADFLDALYEFYAPGTGCYTGLFQRFQSDITEFTRHLVTRRGMTIAELFRAGLEL